MDNELLSDIRAGAIAQNRIHELDGTAAETVLRSVASQYVSKADTTWWWDALKVQSRRMYYTENDVSGAINKLLGKNQEVRLVITDDELPPWPVFEGPLDQVLMLIAAQRFFEYFLVPARDDLIDWIIFDTHHNELVVAGKLAEAAK